MENDNHEQIKQMIIIDHVHPLKERLIGVEKSVEHHEQSTVERFKTMDDRMGRAEGKLDVITEKVDENHDLVKKIWNSMWGGGVVIIAAFTFIKWVLPLLHITG